MIIPELPHKLLSIYLDDYMTDAPIQLRRTVNNDQMRMQPLLRPSKLSVSSPYSWKAPQQVRKEESNFAQVVYVLPPFLIIHWTCVFAFSVLFLLVQAEDTLIWIILQRRRKG